MAFDLFGSETKCDIKVGYISTDRGLVEGIGLYEANQHAKLNPGAQFIFRNRNKVEYLNINEVNKLTPARMLPSDISAKPKGCSGIVGLNFDGDTSKSHDDAYDQRAPFTGGTTQGEDGAIADPDNTRINFYGGGGVGVQAVPVISPINGSVMSVIVTQGGYGYKYPPIVDISDDTGKGAGASLKAILRDPSSDDPVFVEEFDQEEDFEEYDLETCAPELEKIPYGQRFSPDGKVLGNWNPSTYLSVGFGEISDPIRLEIERYQKFLADLQEGSIVNGNRIKDWWTTRQKPPLRITSADKVTREKFDVQHFAWGGLESDSANNSSKNSLNQASSTFGVNIDFIKDSFLVYTSGGQRRNLKFIFKEISGGHTFEIRADDYKDNASAEKIGIEVRRNTKYKVTTTSRKGIRDQGLLKKGTFGTGGDIAQRGGTSNAIFSDIAKTAPDDDDLQVQSTLGIFTDDGKGGITYEFKNSSAFNAGSNSGSKAGSGKGSGNGSNKENKPSFMNTYAISPTPPSNVAGSDNAGKTYVFEWEEEIPYDGEYVFNIQADNESHLYIDNDPVGDKILLGSGGAAGHTLSPPTKIKKHLTKGMNKIQLNLLNYQIREMKKFQTDVESGGTAGDIKDVTFKVNIGTLYAAGIKLSDENTVVFEDDKGYAKPSVSETHNKNIEVGKVYDVEFTSSNTDPNKNLNVNGIEYKGLKKAGDLRYSNAKRLEFDDDSSNGFDINASFTIDNVVNGNASFAEDGKSFIVKGSNVQVTLTYNWSDNPRRSGTALSSIKIGSTTWTHLRKSRGSETHTITLSDGKSGLIRNDGSNNSAIKLRNKGKNVIEMEDIPTDFSAGTGGTNDEAFFFKDIVCSATDGEFYNIQGRKCKFRIPSLLQQGILPESTGNQKGERAHVFNTVDWIKRANRKLWKMNPLAGKDCNFLNQFGVLPFDPTKVEKKVKKTVEAKPIEAPPSVNFEVGDDGKNYLKVTGDKKVKIVFQMDVDRVGNNFGAPLLEARIQCDGSTSGHLFSNTGGEVILRRTSIVKRETIRATGIFSPGKKYLVRALGGGSATGSRVGVDKTILQYDNSANYKGGINEQTDRILKAAGFGEDDPRMVNLANGFDGRGYADIKIRSITPVKESIEETAIASSDDYAGFHEIIWNNLNFPEAGNYAISVMVDDNTELTFTKPNRKDIVIKKDGYKIRGDGRTGTGISVEIRYFESGTYTLKAILEQIPGASLTNGNPMGLAIDIKAAFFSNEVEVISAKSWNENPMGVAMTIDAPLAPPPKEPRQQQEGRCPNNPIWTTRASADKTWYPVVVDEWAKFMNRYSISPLPPLGIKGTDGAGTVYRNSWKVQLPYRGYYGVKGTVDNFGKLFIDGVEVLGPNADTNFDSAKSLSPQTKKILLEEKTVDITVEVENEKQFIWNTIDEKIFSTADWASKQNNISTTIEGPKNIDVDFKVSIATMYGAGIKLSDGNTVLFDDDKPYDAPAINETHTQRIEVGKVYDVEFTSSNTSPNKNLNVNGIVYTGLKEPGDLRYSNEKRLEFDDNSGNGFDINASFTIDNVLNGNASFAADGKSFIVKGSNVKVTLTYSWNDNPRRSGTALSSIKIGTTTWTHLRRSSGSETHTITLSDGKSGVIRNDGSNNSAIALRNKGKNVVEMEDIPDDFSAGTGGTNDENIFYKDVVCSATDGEFYNLQGRKCKFRIPSKDKTTIEYGKGLTPGSSKGGVSYDGPPISTYVSGALGPFLTPTWNTDEEYIANFNGKTWTMTFSDVDFPEKGTYDIQAEADDKLTVKLDGVEIATSEVGNGITKTEFNAPKGKRTLELTLMNLDFNAPFSQNPAVAAVKITRKVQVAKVDPRTGTAQGKPWTVNPLGVSAILIPPPCPKKIRGVGIVSEVTIIPDCDGFDYPPPSPPPGGGDGTPVIVEVVEVVGDPGINYADDDQVCIVNKETGEEICYVPPKGPFGEIYPFEPIKVRVGPGDPPEPPPGTDGPDLPPPTEPPTTPPPDPELPLPPPSRKVPPKPPNSYLSPPAIRVITKTGIGYGGRPKLVPVIDPIGVDDPNRLIQVTDLPGLKRTGYYDGKPYYGAVFYENGVRFAGYYDTPGQKVQIYDTMQESIDARVTTPPSAIQRQGTDINSNDPRLNIPGTPDNLT